MAGATWVWFWQADVSKERPDSERAGYGPERYGYRWSPVLISWTDPTEVPGLAGPTVGVGGSLRLETSGPTGFEKPKSVYVTGTTSLDGPQFAEIPSASEANKVTIPLCIICGIHYTAY